jgi:hypothetical protein
VRGVFAKAVTGGEDRGDAAFGQHACGGDRNGEDCGLRVFRELELVFGTLEDELREGKSQSFVSFVEDGAIGGKVVVEISAHTDSLGALTGEEEGYLVLIHRR